MSVVGENGTDGVGVGLLVVELVDVYFGGGDFEAIGEA